MISIADIYRKTYRYNLAETSYRQAITSIENLPLNKQNSLELSMAYRGLGLVFKKKADYDNALAMYQHGIDLIKSTGEGRV